MSMRVYIGIGSNTADSREQVQKAIDKLHEIVAELCASTIYSTASVSGDGTSYSNAVVCCRAEMPIFELNAQLKEMELQFGRTSAIRQQGVVPIDLDIVVADGHVLRARDYSREYFQRGYNQLLSDMDQARSRSQM